MYRGVEQLVARRAHNPKVAGSSPATATQIERVDRQVGPFLMFLPAISSVYRFDAALYSAVPYGVQRAEAKALLISVFVCFSGAGFAVK